MHPYPPLILALVGRWWVLVPWQGRLAGLIWASEQKHLWPDSLASIDSVPKGLFSHRRNRPSSGRDLY